MSDNSLKRTLELLEGNKSNGKSGKLGVLKIWSKRKFRSAVVSMQIDILE